LRSPSRIDVIDARIGDVVVDGRTVLVIVIVVVCRTFLLVVARSVEEDVTVVEF